MAKTALPHWGSEKETMEPCPYCKEPDALLVVVRVDGDGESHRYENPKHSDARRCVAYLTKRVEQLEGSRAS